MNERELHSRRGERQLEGASDRVKSRIRPITDRQREILEYLRELQNARGYLKYPAPPSRIAYGIGMNRLPAVTATGSGSGKGSGHRVFNPAQRIIGSLNGLRRRGMVWVDRRPDGLSGPAYGITEIGLEVLERSR